SRRVRTAGCARPPSLRCAAADWNLPQTVTVTGVDDAVDDGDVPYGVQPGAATSSDPNYAGMDAADVAAVNSDDDAAGISVTPTAGLVTTEFGGGSTFAVVLTSQPVADVVIPIASSNPAEGTPSAASLTFTAADWNLPQTVLVAGVDDAVDDGDVAYTIVLGAASSSDPDYADLDAADVAVTNTDDDAAGITVTPTAGLLTREAGGRATIPLGP